MTKASTTALAPFLRAALVLASLAAASTGQSLALGKPVTASGFEATSYPEYAVDGDASLTNWWGASPYPQWLQVDLGTVAKLDQLRLTTYWDGNRYYQYTVEASVTGASWIEVVDMSANQAPATAAGSQHDLSGVTARFVRVHMLFNSANPGVHIVELEVGGTPLAPGEIDVHPATSVDLGVQDVNAGPSAPQSIVIRNWASSGFLSIEGVALTGGAPEDFAILSDSGEHVLGPTQAREIVVAFDPKTSAGPRPRIAALTIHSDDTDEPVVEVALTGRARGALLSLIPWPAKLDLHGGSLVLDERSRVVAADVSLSPLADVVADEIYLLTSARLGTAVGAPKQRDVYLSIDPLLAEEQLRMAVGPRAEVRGGTYEAVATGTARLLQLLGSDLSIPHLRIDDAPQAAYRALSLDVARKFHSIDVLKQLVVLCRLYGVRYLGLHLTDDQNFMFPSTAFPLLDGDNFDQPAYSLAELQGLEQFAAVRGVHLVPELDVPGHSSKMVKQYPGVFGSLSGGTIDFQLPSCVAGVKTILSEMCDVFTATPYVHIGGDESGYTHLPAFPGFVSALNDHLATRGKDALMWEGFGPGTSVPKDVTVLSWDGSSYAPDALLSDGYTVVNASWYPLYVVDHYPWIQYSYHTQEQIYAFDALTFGHIASGSPTFGGLTVPRGSAVPGAELCWWEGKEFNAVPFLRSRVPPFAARLWNPSYEHGFAGLQERYHALDAKLEALLFPVAVSGTGIITDFLKQSKQFAGVTSVTLDSVVPGTIRYTLDGSEPTASSPTYFQSFDLTATSTVKAALFDGAQRLGFTTRVGFQAVTQVTSVTGGKPVTTDASLFLEHPPHLVVDGVLDTDTYWSAYPNPQWIQVDLGAPTDLDAVVVVTHWGGGYWEQYTAEVSADGQTWVQIADMSTNTQPAGPTGYAHGFPATSVRYIRVNTLGNSWLEGQFPRIVEILAREVLTGG